MDWESLPLLEVLEYELKVSIGQQREQLLISLLQI
jgi:hypothetical protein